MSAPLKASGQKTPYLTTSAQPKPKAVPTPSLSMSDKIELRAEVPSELGGQRLDQVAALLFAEHSRSRLSAWIKEGLMTVDGAVLRPRDIVHGGALLALKAEQEAERIARKAARHQHYLDNKDYYDARSVAQESGKTAS